MKRSLFASEVILVNCNLQKLHAKHAVAARVQRIVMPHLQARLVSRDDSLAHDMPTFENVEFRTVNKFIVSDTWIQHLTVAFVLLPGKIGSPGPSMNASSPWVIAVG